MKSNINMKVAVTREEHNRFRVVCAVKGTKMNRELGVLVRNYLKRNKSLDAIAKKSS